MTLLVLFYDRVGILLACAKHLDDYITLLRWKVWAHIYSLSPTLIIEVPVPSQEIPQSCIYVLGVPILILHFGLCRQCCILELFQQCGVFELFRQCGILECFRQCGILQSFRECGIMIYILLRYLLLFFVIFVSHIHVNCVYNCYGRHHCLVDGYRISVLQITTNMNHLS